MADKDYTSQSKVKQKRKLNTGDQDESGIPEKVARYDTGEYSNDVTKDRTKDKSLTTTDSFNSTLSSGYGSWKDFQSPCATRDGKSRLAEFSPADSAFAISPSQPASNMVGAPTSVGYSSGIEPDTPDMKAVQSGTTVPFLNPEERIQQFLHKHFVNLKDNLEPKHISGHLYTDGIISASDLEIITEMNHRRERSDYLIKALARSKKLSETTSVLKLQKVMESAGCGHLISELLTEDKNQDDVKTTLWKTHDIKSQFYAYGDKMKEDVDPKLFIDELVVSGVLSLSDHTYISQTTHREDAVENLIRCVVKKPEHSFMPFCRALEENYAEIAKLLLNPNGVTRKEDQTRSTLTGIMREASITFKQGIDSGENPETRVKINLPENNKDVEKMMVDDYNANPNEVLEEEAMDVGFEVAGFQYSSIRIDLTGRSCHSQLRFLQRITKTPSYMKKWLQCALSQKYLQSISMAEAKNVFVEIHAKWPVCSDLPCRCKLKKEAIVKQFTYVERELKYVGNIVEAFKECAAFDDETKQSFKSLNVEDTDTTQNEAFLRRVLNCKNTVCLCLFEKQLHDTEQKPLLQKLLSENQKQVAVKKIQTRHIRKNMNYLLEEIEPRMFVDELRALPRSDAIVEVMISKELRLHKCRQFLEFIIKEGKTAMEWFVDVLEKKDLTAILHILKSCVAAEGTDDYAEGIVAHYERIVNNIDARVLRQTFVDRKEIKAKDFDRIMKHVSRRERVIWLVKHVLNSQKSVQRCFVDALHINGYTDLAKVIRSEKDQYRECPRLSALLNQGNAVTIKVEFEIIIEKGDNTESPLQILLHQSIFSSKFESSEETVYKNEHTRRWIENLTEPNCVVDEEDTDLGFETASQLFNSAEKPSPTVPFSHADDGYHTGCSEVSPASFPCLYEDISPASSPRSCIGNETMYKPKHQCQFEDISAPTSPYAENTNCSTSSPTTQRM